MRIETRGLNRTLTPAIAGHVRRRVGLALAPSARASVRGVIVRLRDVNGPRGGEDKGCRVVVRLRDRKAVVVDAVDRDLYAAIDAAAAKLKRSAWRQLRRGRTLRREYANRGYANRRPRRPVT